MRSSSYAGIILLTLLVSSYSVGFTLSQTDGTINRVIYMEPGFHLYEDDVVLPTTMDNYTIGFRMASLANAYSINAYGPQNESLSVAGYWNQTSGTLTITITTQNVTSFRLITILHAMTTYSNNYTAQVNFFPIVNSSPVVTTTAYLPSNALLLNYTPSDLSNSTSGSRAMISGSAQLTPETTTFGNVSFNGTYSIIEAESLNRVITVTSSGLKVEENILVTNLVNSIVRTVVFDAPKDASGLGVYDSIGSMDFNLTSQNLTVTLRTRLYPNEHAGFTIAYILPLSGYVQVDGSRNLISGNLLPEWCKILVKEISLTIIAPAASSDATIQGGTFSFDNGTINAKISNVSLTPYANRVYSLSYSPSSSIPNLGLIIAIALAAVAVIGYILFRKFGPKKSTIEKSPPPQSPQPEPKKDQPSNDQPKKYKPNYKKH
ncbi:MAG: hypothetical protein LUP94_01610 [Candidatus Methanomethylicus sp.]|nr:hypothetical protein [Candidatus Methanomethylicus sp.]